MPTSQIIAGWTLSIVGMLFVVLGFVAAAVETVRGLLDRSPEDAQDSAIPDIDSVTELLKAFNQVLRTLLSSPRWLLLVAVGVGLVLVGNMVLR